jgi:hypothetical protein
MTLGRKSRRQLSRWGGWNGKIDLLQRVREQCRAVQMYSWAFLC